MRLLNTTTLALRTFFGEAVPDYAILSHRWEEKEVSFQDLQDGKGKAMAGYSKIRNCCAQAHLDGWQYVWIDSCCIDKTNSVELSEAINSMYQWYKKAQVCYAYLGDVYQRWIYSEERQLQKSKWFTRGWTLQELLAPSTMIFFDHDWIDIGTKGSLQGEISEITGIYDFVDFETASVAQKMSWAAKRETTRVEDMAYCLLGLFDVNMPPLYGEGKKAFMRLQMEILKISDDESIFAWKGKTSDGFGGLLAPSPKQFKDSGRVRLLEGEAHKNDFFKGDNHPFSMTNKGLYISLLLIPHELDHEGSTSLNPPSDVFAAPLKCSSSGGVVRSRVVEGEGVDLRPAILLNRKIVGSVERYSRIHYDRLLLLNPDNIQRNLQGLKSPAYKYIYIEEYRRRDYEHSTLQHHWSFSIIAPSMKDHGFVIAQVDPVGLPYTWGYVPQGEISLLIQPVHGTVAGVKFMNSSTGESIILVIVAQKNRSPWLIAFTPEATKELRDITGQLSELYISAPSPVERTQDVTDSGAGASIKKVQPTSERKPPLDRMSWPLGDRKSVSASLRHVKAEIGGRRFFIDIGIDPTSELYWLPPTWLNHLLVSIGNDGIKSKQQTTKRLRDRWQRKETYQQRMGLMERERMERERVERKQVDEGILGLGYQPSGFTPSFRYFCT